MIFVEYLDYKEMYLRKKVQTDQTNRQTGFAKYIFLVTLIGNSFALLNKNGANL